MIYRSGTLNTPGIVGLGAACEIAGQEMESESKRIKALGDRLISKMTSQLSHVVRNGHPEHTYPGCVNLSFGCVEGNGLNIFSK